MMQKEYKLANTTIDAYFQKSYKFLYPLLAVGKEDAKPLQTYVSWKGYHKITDLKLICVYELGVVIKTDPVTRTSVKTEDHPAYSHFEKTLFKNPFFETFVECEDNKGVYVFTMEEFTEDWYHFICGRYSQFSKTSKQKILNYYKINPFSEQYMDSYLHPDKYFSTYAKLLNVDEAILVDVGELCDSYRLSKEQLDLKEAPSPTLNTLPDE